MDLGNEASTTMMENESKTAAATAEEETKEYENHLVRDNSFESAAEEQQQQEQQQNENDDDDDNVEDERFDDALEFQPTDNPNNNNNSNNNKKKNKNNKSGDGLQRMFMECSNAPLFHFENEKERHTPQNEKQEDVNESSTIQSNLLDTEEQLHNAEHHTSTNTTTTNNNNNNDPELSNEATTTTTTSSFKPATKAANNGNDDEDEDDDLLHLSERPKVHSIAFNQDRSCVAIGTSKGYRIRTISPNQPLRLHQKALSSSNTPQRDAQSRLTGASFLGMLYSSSLFTLVRPSAPRTLSLIHAHQGTTIRDLHFASPVLRAEINSQTLVVFTADAILHIFQTSNLRLLDTLSVLHRSSESPRSITPYAPSMMGTYFDLSTYCDDQPSYLICRSGLDQHNNNDAHDEQHDPTIHLRRRTGRIIPGRYVSVYDTRDGNLQCLAHVRASTTLHGVVRIAIGRKTLPDEPIKFATATQKGTMIHIFRLPDCQTLYVLWRGSTPCTIHSLSFNASANRLAVSGSSETLHIFDLQQTNQPTPEEEQSDNFLSRNATRLLDAARDSWISSSEKQQQQQQQRSYAKIRLRLERMGESNKEGRNMVTFLEPQDLDSILICTMEGRLYEYHVNYPDGKCSLTQTEDLLFDDVMMEEEEK